MGLEIRVEGSGFHISLVTARMREGIGPSSWLWG